MTLMCGYVWSIFATLKLAGTTLSSSTHHGGKRKTRYWNLWHTLHWHLWPWKAKLYLENFCTYWWHCDNWICSPPPLLLGLSSSSKTTITISVIVMIIVMIIIDHHDHYLQTWCRLLHIVTTYLMLTTYSWMLCEGTYLKVILVTSQKCEQWWWWWLWLWWSWAASKFTKNDHNFN